MARLANIYCRRTEESAVVSVAYATAPTCLGARLERIATQLPELRRRSENEELGVQPMYRGCNILGSPVLKKLNSNMHFCTVETCRRKKDITNDL